ncbi:WD repeat-containing protein 36 [Drosophila guanche]|uniref:Blast:WD repeat-containing protein 36 n=1 Tax=Drosophila guanche TaxID=7266 RepID=A0A3B0K0M9_DROGU|nr:WD repeat-containing protein 36 [Drosophila guanche]SPP87867.1 blast:WD repeat-containing protein 36 [Drosophila guanche]
MTEDNKESEPRAVFKESSKIFRRNRALGYVSNQVPAVTRYVQRRRDTLLITCIGRSFQVYTASHFRLLHVSGLHPDEITALATDRLHTYTASNKCIYAWRAGKHIRHVYRGHNRDVHLLLPFGSNLIAVDHENVLKVWNIFSEDVYLEVPFKVEEFQITAVAHPPTYINKIVLGSRQGQIKILNIKKNSIVCTFNHHESRVTCIEPAPALDVVAVGHGDGAIIVLNLKFDEVLMAFKQDWGVVTSLAFRTDGPPILVSACRNGYMAFWNLEERKLAGQLQAHEQQVTTAICFPSEPVVFTTSPDNSMKLFVFDMPDGGARQLRIREGHTKPPLCIRYHGSSGVSILSSGEDSTLRVFSTLSESLNKSMGRASYNPKATKYKNRFQFDKYSMPPILEFTSDTAREKEWDNIAAIHAGIIQTTTWTFDKNRMGEHRLVPKQFQNKNRVNFESETTCIVLTHCGNFVIIGYSSGDIERFNIQSGLHRARYGAPAHTKAVRGLASDNLNQCVISGCSEGLLKFWPFKGKVDKPVAVLRLADGISIMRQHRESSMLAIGLETFKVYVIDMHTRVIVRKFVGHTAKLNDLTFSPDSRWLITAAMDSTIKVWDIPSSYMIDHFRVERPCVSLSMSPNGDFLATVHVNLLGIYLWANKTLFNQISLRSIDPYEPAPYVGLPTNICDAMDLADGMKELEIDGDEEELGETIDAQYETPKQLSPELITLSGLAASRWQNLLDLELIKQRNKPKAPPKAPKQAPFFLPTVSGLEMRFDVTNAASDKDSSRILQASTLNNLTTFGQLLEETASSSDFNPAVTHIIQLGPSMIDFEIKSLHPEAGGTLLAMVQFLKLIEFMFSTNLNFELAQSYLSVFLRSHGLALTESPDLVRALRSVSQVQEQAWDRVESKLNYGTGVVAALRNFAN